MKPRILVLVLVVLCLVCLIIFLRALVHQEEKGKVAEIQDAGSRLSGLISLYPVKAYSSEKKDVILRTIMESIPREQFLYLSIHDQKGVRVAALSSTGNGPAVPGEVSSKSLYSSASILQSYHLPGTGETAYEFSEPIFEGDARTGTVRLGLRPAPSVLLSLEHVSLLSIIAFFIFSAMLIGYYGITQAIYPLGKISSSLKRISAEQDAAPDLKPAGNFIPIINDMEKSLVQVKEKLNRIQTENIVLVSRIGSLEFENNQMAKALDLVPAGILMTDLQGHVTHINGVMQKRLGKKPGDVIDRPLDAILPDPNVQKLIQAETNMDQRNLLLEFPDFAPEEVLLVSVSYILDNEHAPVSRLILFKDMTAARRAEQTQHEFIAHVAHELRTPLTNIRSYNEMLMVGEVIDDETKKDFYNTIHQETTRLSDLIQNLLDISRIEIGGMTLNKGLVRTDWFVEGCMNSVEAAARGKNIAIEKKLPDVFPSMMADKDLLKAAIINILGNAVKYTPEFGKITFSISEANGLVVFDVADTGYGIASEDLPNIFKKFFRSDNPEIKEKTGTGLGLAIASEIVHLHEGEIEVSSEPGKGSRFSIKIPREGFYIARP